MVTIKRLPDFVESVDVWEIPWKILEIDGQVLRIFNSEFFDTLMEDADSMSLLKDWTDNANKLERLGLIEKVGEDQFEGTPKLEVLLPILRASLESELPLEIMVDEKAPKLALQQNVKEREEQSL